MSESGKGPSMKEVRKIFTPSPLRPHCNFPQKSTEVFYYVRKLMNQTCSCNENTNWLPFIHVCYLKLF